jgi:hypothetical protein
MESTPRSWPPGKGLPKDEAGNFIASQEKSDVVHDLLAFLAESMPEMNKEKQTEIKGFLGWLESYVGAKVEDLTPKTVARRATTSKITRGFLAVAQKEQQEAASRSGQTGACTGAPGRVRGIAGQAGAALGTDPGRRTS